MFFLDFIISMLAIVGAFRLVYIISGGRLLSDVYEKEEKIKEVSAVFEELKIKEIATSAANAYIEKAFELL